MLVHLTYYSLSTQPVTDNLLLPLRDHAVEHNAEHGITGCLLTIGDYFVQTVEGRDDVINELYRKIIRDDRNTRVQLVQYNQISKRSFLDWLFVARVDTNEYRDTILKYSSRTPFSFHDATSATIDMLINDIYLDFKKKKKDGQ
jgi:hypothetical protein